MPPFPLPQNPGLIPNTPYRCRYLLEKQQRLLEAKWFPYLLSLDARESLREDLASAQALKDRVNVSMLAERFLVVSLTELSLYSGKLPLGSGSVDVACSGARRLDPTTDHNRPATYHCDSA